MAENFITAGFGELRRKFARSALRRTMHRNDTERGAALVVLGQKAWEERIELSAFADVRDRLAALEARAGELTQASGKLAEEKASLEAQRSAQLQEFAGRRGAVESRKGPIDAALAAARTKKNACEQSIKMAESRLASIAAAIAKMDPAAQEQRAQLTGEQGDLTVKRTAAQAQLPGLAAEESRLAAESQKCAAEIAAIDAEQKTAIARIDAALRSASSGLQDASRQSSAVQGERAGAFGSLGKGLYDSGTREPALADPVERIAGIDRARAETEIAHAASLTETQSLESGTMPKFWSVTAGVPLLLIAVALGSYYYVGTRGAPATAVAPTARLDGEDGKDLLVMNFIGAGKNSDRKLRDEAVRVLKEDILEMGATADPSHLSALAIILRSPHAELRAAAADAIGMIGATQDEVPELERLTKDSAAEVANAAKRALAARSVAKLKATDR